MNALNGSSPNSENLPPSAETTPHEPHHLLEPIEFDVRDSPEDPTSLSSITDQE